MTSPIIIIFMRKSSTYKGRRAGAKGGREQKVSTYEPPKKNKGMKVLLMVIHTMSHKVLAQVSLIHEFRFFLKKKKKRKKGGGREKRGNNSTTGHDNNIYMMKPTNIKQCQLNTLQ